MSKTRRQFKREFKISVLTEVDAGKSLAQVSRENELDKALEDRWDGELRGNLIHHSDQGVQYASDLYIKCLEDHGILISMSRKGNPYDNAFIESFIGTLKCEEVYLNEYETFSDVLDNIPSFIEDVYNRKRLHSSLGYRSPIAFEKEVNLNTLA